MELLRGLPRFLWTTGGEPSGDGWLSDLLGGSYLRERAIRGCREARQGPAGVPGNSSPYAREVDQERAEFLEAREAQQEA